jgi:hypothetical protein
MTDIQTTADQRHGACLLCHQQDPASGIACHPCRDRLYNQLDDIETLWPLVPDELLNQRGGINYLAVDLLLPIPTELSRRFAGSVRDVLIPKVRTWTTAVEMVDQHNQPYRINIVQGEVVLDADGHPLLVPAGDQHGAVPLLHWLDQWARYWLELRDGPARRLPNPNLIALTSALGRLIDWAADTDRDAAVDDFARELAEQTSMLRRVTHSTPIHQAAECPRCNRRSLWRMPGSRYVRCSRAACGLLLKPLEYDQHVTAQVNALGEAS